MGSRKTKEASEAEVDEVREAGEPWLVQEHTGQGKKSGFHSGCNEKPFRGAKLGSGTF